MFRHPPGTALVTHTRAQHALVLYLWRFAHVAWAVPTHDRSHGCRTWRPRPRRCSQRNHGTAADTPRVFCHAMRTSQRRQPWGPCLRENRLQCPDSRRIAVGGAGGEGCPSAQTAICISCRDQAMARLQPHPQLLDDPMTGVHVDKRMPTTPPCVANSPPCVNLRAVLTASCCRQFWIGCVQPVSMAQPWLQRRVCWLCLQSSPQLWQRLDWSR